MFETVPIILKMFYLFFIYQVNKYAVEIKCYKVKTHP
jgi:hypothetical protein